MIKTTIDNIYKANTATQKLAEQALPVKVSYGIAKIMSAVNAELEAVEPQRVKLCEKYGKLSEDGQKYIIHNPVDFDREFNELLSLPVELNVNKLKLTDDMKLSAQDILDLEDFIEVSEDD
ncbi:MAG: hypothetical protein MJ168_05390 [Clostridia bacterium]|nr:hypothetical protein [Clostridia bacterium]